MKQIVFISGKGGTGKSTVVASLGDLVTGRVMADCDVDAANLHLLLTGVPERPETETPFIGAETARIDPDRCVACGLCRQVCRFDAIDPQFRVSDLACEGCGACMVLCPADAISMEPVQTGVERISRTARGPFAHAELYPGAEASGKLVSRVRRNARTIRDGEDWILVDGSPGIGCAVIASITGTDAVVAVTEPSPTARADLLRVLEVARHFDIRAYVCINKYDLHPGMTADIESACRAQGVPVIGKIPFNPEVVTALRQGETPVRAGIRPVTDAITALWDRITEQLGTPGA